LLESNKLDFLRDTALNDLAERYGTLVESRDVEKGIIKYWGVFSDQHNNSEPVEALVTYDFYKKHKEELFKNAESVTKAIDKLVYQKAEVEESSKGLLENINKELHYLFLRIDKLYPDYPELTKSLKYIENHLLIRYQVKPFAKKRADEKFSYFGFKDTISRGKFVELYEFLEERNILEYDVVSEEDFLEVLLQNPSNSEIAIKFNCSNDLMVTFLERIRPYFSSLSPKSIEISKRLYTKQGKIISESNYNKNTSLLKKKPSEKANRLLQDLNAILKD
jgi:hypothetical protein